MQRVQNYHAINHTKIVVDPYYFYICKGSQRLTLDKIKRSSMVYRSRFYILAVNGDGDLLLNKK